MPRRTTRPMAAYHTPIIYTRNPANFGGLPNYGDGCQKTMDLRTGFWTYKTWLGQDDFGNYSDVRGNGLDTDPKKD